MVRRMCPFGTGVVAEGKVHRWWGPARRVIPIQKHHLNHAKSKISIVRSCRDKDHAKKNEIPIARNTDHVKKNEISIARNTDHAKREMAIARMKGECAAQG